MVRGSWTERSSGARTSDKRASRFRDSIREIIIHHEEVTPLRRSEALRVPLYMQHRWCRGGGGSPKTAETVEAAESGARE